MYSALSVDAKNPNSLNSSVSSIATITSGMLNTWIDDDQYLRRAWWDRGKGKRRQVDTVAGGQIEKDKHYMYLDREVVSADSSSRSSPDLTFLGRRTNLLGGGQTMSCFQRLLNIDRPCLRHKLRLEKKHRYVCSMCQPFR